MIQFKYKDKSEIKTNDYMTLEDIENTKKVIARYHNVSVDDIEVVCKRKHKIIRIEDIVDPRD